MGFLSGLLGGGGSSSNQGGGFFGSGAKSTETANLTTNTTDEVAIQVGDESVGIGRANDINITDGGAFSDAVSYARDALDVPTRALDAIVDVTARAGDRMLDATRDAVDLVEDVNDRSFNFAENLFGDSLDATRDSQSEALDFARGIVKSSQDSLGGTVTALNTIAREQSKSTDERVQELAKYVVLGVVALGAAFVFARRG